METALALALSLMSVMGPPLSIFLHLAFSLWLELISSSTTFSSVLHESTGVKSADWNYRDDDGDPAATGHTVARKYLRYRSEQHVDVIAEAVGEVR